MLPRDRTMERRQDAGRGRVNEKCHTGFNDERTGHATSKFEKETLKETSNHLCQVRQWWSARMTTRFGWCNSSLSSERKRHFLAENPSKHICALKKSFSTHFMRRGKTHFQRENWQFTGASSPELPNFYRKTCRQRRGMFPRIKWQDGTPGCGQIAPCSPNAHSPPTWTWRSLFRCRRHCQCERRSGRRLWTKRNQPARSILSEPWSAATQLVADT